MTKKVMEDNLHNDKLEEFLKNSLQGYSEEPPGDLWGKIEGGLAPVPVAPPVRSIRWGWWAAAAAVAGGLFIGQHFYFSKQLNSLNQQLEQNEALLRNLGEEKKAGKVPMPSTENEKAPQAFENQSIEKENLYKPTPPTKAGKHLLKPSNSNTNPEAASQKNTYSSPQNSTSPGTPIAQANGQTAAGAELAPLPQVEIFEQKNDAILPTQVGTVKSQPDFLPAKHAWLVAQNAQPNLNLPAAAAAITPVKKPGNFSLGLHAMPMATWEKITSVRNKMPHQGRKVFRDTSTSKGESFYAGVAAEYQTSPRFYLGSGIDYHKTAISSSHTADFKLGDRRPHGEPMGGQHDFRHDFQYDLNTAAGLVEIEVRAEQADTSLDFPDDEEIGLSITTQQDLEYLSFPIYGRYEMGNGQWRFFVKGGLMANFLLSNSFEITNIHSENNHFRFEKRQQPGGTQQNLQTMSLDFLAGVGVDYAFSKRLKLRVEPSFIGSLTSNHNNPNIQSSQYSAGVNAGLMYVF